MEAVNADLAAREGSPESPPLLEVTDLGVQLPTGERDTIQAVDSISLSIRAGERVGIVGESGTGKSVTGRAVAGLLPDSKRVRVRGSIRFRGTEMVGASPSAVRRLRRHDVGMIFQDPLSYLNPTMRIERQLLEAVPHEDRTRASALIDEYMEMVGLPNVPQVRRQYPFELSGGMRQRVMIAMALAKKPSLLIADEPTTALDVTVQAKVLRSLTESVERVGSAMMMITHDLAVVSETCERVYVLYGGRVVESGHTEQVFNDPQHPYTKALIRSVLSLTDESTDFYSFSGEELNRD